MGKEKTWDDEIDEIMRQLEEGSPRNDEQKLFVPKRAPPTCLQRGGKTGRRAARRFGGINLAFGALLALYNIMVRGIIIDATDKICMAGVLAILLSFVVLVGSLCFCRVHVTKEELLEKKMKRRQARRQKHKEDILREDLRNPLRQANAEWLKQHHTGKLSCLQHIYWFLRIRVGCRVRMRLGDHPAHFLPYIDIFKKIGVYKRKHIVPFVNTFLRMDKDRSGTVDVEEFLCWINYDADVQFTASIFDTFDVDKSGELEFPEWVIALVNFCLADDKYYAGRIYDTYAKSKYGGKTVMRSKDTDAMILEMFGERGLHAAKENTSRSKATKDNLFLARKKMLRMGMNYSVEVGLLKNQFLDVVEAHPILISRIKDLAFKITLMVGGSSLWSNIANTKEETLKRMEEDAVKFELVVLEVLSECAVRRAELVDMDKRHRNIIDPPPPRVETKQERKARHEMERQMKQVQRQMRKSKEAEAASKKVDVNGEVIGIGQLIQVRKNVAAPENGWRGVLPGKSIGTLVSLAKDWGQPAEERGCIINFPEPIGQWAGSLGHVEKYTPPRVQLAPIGHLRRGVSDRPHDVRFGVDGDVLDLESGDSTHTLLCTKAYTDLDKRRMDLENEVKRNRERLAQEHIWVKLQAIPSKMIPRMISELKKMKAARRLARRQHAQVNDRRMVRHSMMTKKEIEEEKQSQEASRYLKRMSLPISRHVVNDSPTLARALPVNARIGIVEEKRASYEPCDKSEMQKKLNQSVTEDESRKMASETTRGEILSLQQMMRFNSIRSKAFAHMRTLGEEQGKLRREPKIDPHQGLTPEIAKGHAEGKVPDPSHWMIASYLDTAPADHDTDDGTEREKIIRERNLAKEKHRVGQMSPISMNAHLRCQKRSEAARQKLLQRQQKGVDPKEFCRNREQQENGGDN